MTIEPTQLLGFAGAPLLIALVQLIKYTFPDAPSTVWPLVTLAMAVAWNIGLSSYLHADLGMGAILGILTGLAASGLYSHATTLTQPTLKVPLPPEPPVQ